MSVPYWRSDRYYYPVKDARRAAHIAELETQERINQRIKAACGDHSYAVVVTAKEMAQ